MGMISVFAGAMVGGCFGVVLTCLVVAGNLYCACMEETILAGERAGGDGTLVTRKKERVEAEKKAKKKKGRRDAFD